MSAFILDDKNFQSFKADVKETDTTFEVRKIDSTLYSIFQHHNGTVYEAGTFTKQELKTIWQMLSTK